MTVLTETHLFKLNSGCFYCTDEQIAKVLAVTPVESFVSLGTALLLIIFVPIALGFVVSKFVVGDWYAGPTYGWFIGGDLPLDAKSLVGRELSFHLRSYRKQVLSSGIYRNIGACSLTRQQLRLFVLQRCYRAENFKTLLSVAEQLADVDRKWILKMCLRSNLSEETGMSSDGEFDECLAHSTWRKWWCSGIGVYSKKSDEVFDGVLQYNNYINGVIERADLLEMSVILALLEGSIVQEYRLILVACDTLFYEEMLSDRARKHLVDHIFHDQRHYFELISAIKNSNFSGNLSDKEFSLKISGVAERFIAAGQFFSEDLHRRIILQ